MNALVGWVMIGITTLGGVESFLSNAFLWGVFTLLVVAVASLPAIVNHDWMAVVSWPLLATMAIAVNARVVGFHSEIAGYLTLAMLSLVAIIELTTVTAVKLNRRFAIAFAVLTTMALQALWIVVQFYSDRWLETGFLSTQTALQKDILFVTLIGVAVGLVFERYFTWFEPIGAIESSGNLRGNNDTR